MAVAGTRGLVPSRNDIQEQFERFAAELVEIKWRDTVAKERPNGSPQRGPLPSISAESVYERALELVDREGLDAVTARRLAADLKISTRTLYKRIKNRPNMISNIAVLFASRLAIEVRQIGSWEAAALDWCVDLYRELTSHPHLTALLTDATAARQLVTTDALVDITIAGGMTESAALDVCRTLAITTMYSALAFARAHTDSGATVNAECELIETIGLVIDGAHSRLSAGNDSAGIDGACPESIGVKRVS